MSNCSDMQIMSVGGNGRARQFFKQHGWSELGADKIEQKVSIQDQGIILCLSPLSRVHSSIQGAHS